MKVTCFEDMCSNRAPIVSPEMFRTFFASGYKKYIGGLKDMGVGLHFSEVKGPVMDRLERSHFIEEMNGRVFLSQFDAWSTLTSSRQMKAAE